MLQAKADEPAHVLRCVVRDIAVADAALDEHELIRAGQYIVFIAQQDDIPVRGEDIGQVFTVTERTVIVFMDDGFRLLMADVHVKIEQIVVHGNSSEIIVETCSHYMV